MSDGFLSRWSRVKRGEAAAEPVVEAVPAPAVEAPPVPDVVPEAAPEEELDLSTLPDLESATAETDFTAFLKRGVPEDLKKVALRRAWSLDSNIRDFIGPADYAWDFNAPDGVPGFALTLGGDIAKMVAQAIGQVEKIAERLEEGERAAPAFVPPAFAPPGMAPPPALPEPALEAPAEPVRLLTEAPPPPAHVVEEPEPAPPPRRRHGGALPG